MKNFWKILLVIFLVCLCSCISYVFGYVRGLDDDLLTIPQVVNFCEGKNLKFCSYNTNVNEFTCGFESCFSGNGNLIIYNNPKLSIKEYR